MDKEQVTGRPQEQVFCVQWFESWRRGRAVILGKEASRKKA